MCAQHGHVVNGVSGQWCFGSGVSGVVFREWCFESGVSGVVFREWCFGSGVSGVVFRVSPRMVTFSKKLQLNVTMRGLTPANARTDPCHRSGWVTGSASRRD